jgi:glycosyltransferase involved in cell wall biosynthesis
VSEPVPRTVLHYIGTDEDRGGILSVVRALATARQFECVLGVNPGFAQAREPALPTLELPAVAGEQLGIRSFLRSRKIAAAVGRWLREDPARVFHGHSRVGLLVALRLFGCGERRVVATVHCYGRRRWFYRWSARRLGSGSRLFWLTPAMKRYYGLDGQGSGTWADCMPGCLPDAQIAGTRPAPVRSSGFVRLGGAGALVKWKGWHHVLEAMRLLPDQLRARLRFSHIGSPDRSLESQRYAAALRRQSAGFGSLVEWEGEQLSSREWLGKIDCLLVPSDGEPFSMIMLEALAAGVPVVASAGSGPGDVLAMGRSGWLFDSGSASDLARVLTLLVESDALARVRIATEDLEPFRASTMAGRWARIYARLDHSD